MSSITTLELYLFGNFEARIGYIDFAIHRYKLERALLAYLAAEFKQPHWRDELAELFWPERRQGVARTNLRQVLTGLRKSLSDDGGEQPYLLITRDKVRFNQNSNYWIDLGAYQDCLATIQDHQHIGEPFCSECISNLRRANNLYRGTFLDGPFLAKSTLFQEWVVTQREIVKRQQIQVLEKLSQILFQQGHFEQACELLCKLLEIDPFHEPAYRRLMSTYAKIGRPGDALLQYRICSKILADELNIQPTEETTSLYERIKLNQEI